MTWHYVPSRSYIGAYKALFKRHTPADYIHPDQISAGALADYKALYLPFAFALPRSAAAAIQEFAAAGGVILAEARTAWNDESGYVGAAVPGFGLEQVFGCREAGAEGVDEDTPVMIRVVKEHPALPQLSAGDLIKGARFREALELLNQEAEILGVFEDGSPAVVAHPYGQGWAIFVGTMLSLGYYRFNDPNAGRLLQGVADLAGIQPPVTVGNPEAGSSGLLSSLVEKVGLLHRDLPFEAEIEPHLLHVARRDGLHDYLFFAFNHSAESVQPLFSLALDPGTYQAVDVLSGGSVETTWQDERLSLVKELAPQEIWVVKLTVK